ncbi:MAG: hypothetical protein J6M56_00145 [Clostridia bacterium]|nr:hypothetical protein [Clostridia bacterium]
MDDLGAKWTDEKIEELEERIIELFEDAYDDVYGKYMAFTKRFERDDAKFQQQLQDGKITAATYRDWLRGQVFQRTRWKAQLADLAATLTRVNQIAMDIINEAAPGVFAMNANWASFDIEHEADLNMGFGLYDEDAVKRLLRDEPDLLPPSRVIIEEDERWNMKAIARQIEAGIVTGEGIEEIAKRLQRVATMNANQARTHARTAMTGAQNAGRMESYRRAEEMGIEMEREWIATFDGHTREAHRLLDKKSRPEGKPFVVTYRYGKRIVTDSIMYPGDPDAHPRMVYNCRCTMRAKLLRYPDKDAMRRPNLQEYGDALPQKPIRSMSFMEWMEWKKGA